ncbi:MAG: gliding-motility protein MglA [Candidatus Aegiribacteria sp.]|nr:gliding-motility protein MglA [Candidatus Aegiribacteria sp.]MBD3295623.1 gliding-motility protein MglA [Candidatus Fermentibacteria bacterium]
MHRSVNEVAYKIVYYGPGLSGKTTNLRRIRDIISPEHRGRLVTLCTRGERTVFFDFLPINFASIGNDRVRLHLYSVPGQAYYALSRKVILDGVDGLIFVADSQSERMEANLDSVDDLESNLNSYGIKLEDIPTVLQFNKRDLPSIEPVDKMDKMLNRYTWPSIESVAIGGSGPVKTLKIMSRIIAKQHAGLIS